MRALARVETVPRGGLGEGRETTSWTVRVVGEIDLSNAREVIDDVSGALPHHTAQVVLDLSTTAYVDSAAIAGLFRLAERVQQRRQQLQVVVPLHSPIRKVIELTGLDQLVPVLDTLDASDGPDS